MRILDRYVCREVFTHALLGLAIFTFVFYVPQIVRLMELVVRHSGSTRDTLLLFACPLPGMLAFTLPMGVLIGVLIGLGRLSADSEVVAMNALGIGLRRLLLPIGGLAFATSLLTLAITFWLSPASLRMLHIIADRLRAAEAPYAIQPRVFDERFPHLVLYVQDVAAGGAHWNGVFLAESGAATGSHLTLADNAIVIAGPGEDKLQLHLRNGSTHEYDPGNPTHYNFTTFGTSDSSIDVPGGPEVQTSQLPMPERNLTGLLNATGPEWRDARIDLNRRIAFPAACLVFAMLGVPVGVRPRRGGRSTGFVLTLLLISAYYLLFVFGVHMAQQGFISPMVGVWAANVLIFLAALPLLYRIEHIRGTGRLSHYLDALRARRGPAAEAVAVASSNGPVARDIPATGKGGGRSLVFPLLVDMLLLRSFAFYFFLLLGAFLVVSDSFTLFDLLQSITRNHISAQVVANYFLHLIPMMVYQLAPVAALVATLVTLGLMAKNNEVVAFKASGISLYRLSIPFILTGAILGSGMFLLDNSFLPYANQRSDALRNQIMGRPAQTFYQPAHQWIFGEGNKIYNYGLFDFDHGVFGGLNVFEIDPATFQLRRRVYAARARWEPDQQAWVLDDGWVRDFNRDGVSRYETFRATLLSELTEPPSYFKRAVLPSSQMNWRQLRSYISGLQHAGFDTARLAVEWHRKFAFPVLTLVIMFLGVPFALLTGTRGAVGGLAIGISIAIVYWATAALFQAMGNVGLLPAVMAGWAPAGIFALVSLYFFLKMPT
ncbi:MAG TPA: LptF/LptG family permease [Candidatus Acidoferrales bacterium]|jgi:LPS export ABC transporter permease LptF/LPS export ABC transporter permease LptG|nr:LptF/LptG family permease [Candidatus Acidoferrales bacterium]